MAEKQQKKGKDRPRSAGKHSEKYERHSARVAEKKLRRVLRSSGVPAARKWAAEFGMDTTLTRLLQNLPARIARREQKRLKSTVAVAEPNQ